MLVNSYLVREWWIRMVRSAGGLSLTGQSRVFAVDRDAQVGDMIQRPWGMTRAPVFQCMAKDCAYRRLSVDSLSTAVDS